MSRALGAAFLNHQVEQLEKSVNGQGPASGNWRERRAQSNGQQLQGAVAPRQGATSPGSKDSQPRRKGADRARDGETDRFSATQTSPTRRSGEEDRRAADIIVVDASVLIHALYQVKRWCRDGRDEIIVVPLEGASSLGFFLTFCSFFVRQRSIHWICSRRGHLPSLSVPERRPVYSKLRSGPILASASSTTMPTFHGTRSVSTTDLQHLRRPVQNGSAVSFAVPVGRLKTRSKN